jgi:hypothetical protein
MIVYQGASMIDGNPIVAIATGFGRSRNEKTGNMIQLWILRADVSPLVAIHTGQDSSVCGDCKHRGTIENGKNKGRSCYVTIFQAPRSVYESYKRGIYESIPLESLPDAFADRPVRLGAYGDPAALPLAVIEAITSKAAYFTGYTHAWQRFPELSPYCMASADSSQEKAIAKMLGFRVFRVRSESEAIEAKEIACPASAEMGKKTNCAACKACGGTSSKARVDIAIIAHGSPAVTNAYRERKAA